MPCVTTRMFHVKQCGRSFECGNSFEIRGALARERQSPDWVFHEAFRPPIGRWAFPGGAHLKLGSGFTAWVSLPEQVPGREPSGPPPERTTSLLPSPGRPGRTGERYPG